jgi:hypothetical protein
MRYIHYTTLFDSLKAKEKFLFPKIQVASGTHLASYSIDTEDYISGDKAARKGS